MRSAPIVLGMAAVGVLLSQAPAHAAYVEPRTLMQGEAIKRAMGGPAFQRPFFLAPNAQHIKAGILSHPSKRALALFSNGGWRFFTPLASVPGIGQLAGTTVGAALAAYELAHSITDFFTPDVPGFAEQDSWRYRPGGPFGVGQIMLPPNVATSGVDACGGNSGNLNGWMIAMIGNNQTLETCAGPQPTWTGTQGGTYGEVVNIVPGTQTFTVWQMQSLPGWNGKAAVRGTINPPPGGTVPTELRSPGAPDPIPPQKYPPVWTPGGPGADPTSPTGDPVIPVGGPWNPATPTKPGIPDDDTIWEQPDGTFGPTKPEYPQPEGAPDGVYPEGLPPNAIPAPPGAPQAYPPGSTPGQPGSTPTSPPDIYGRPGPGGDGDPGSDASPAPSAAPSPQPSPEPSPEPSAEPTGEPTAEPTAPPTGQPTAEPTAPPTGEPTAEPSTAPSSQPTPTPEPSVSPGTGPSLGENFVVHGYQGLRHKAPFDFLGDAWSVPAEGHINYTFWEGTPNAWDLDLDWFKPYLRAVVVVATVGLIIAALIAL